MRIEPLEARQLLAVGLVSVEDNNTISTAQVASPVPGADYVIVGKLDGDGDVDLYEITLSAGQSLDVDMDAYRLDDGKHPHGGPASHLRLLDAAGHEVAEARMWTRADPDSGYTDDPVLKAHSVKGGTYYLGVSHESNDSYDATIDGAAAGENEKGGKGKRAGDYQLWLDLSLASAAETELLLEEFQASSEGYGGTNSPPEAYDTNDFVLHDQTLWSYTYAYDPDGDVLTYSSAFDPSNGTLNFNPDGSFDYTPNSGYVGYDTFDYTVSDGVDTDTATVTIQVYNTAPEAYDTSDTISHDQTLSSYVYAYDADGDNLGYSEASGPSNGTLSFNADGSFDYTPNSSYVGYDTFDYTVSDGIVTDTGTVTIQVTNAAPLAAASSESVPHGQTLSSYVYAYDADGDGLAYLEAFAPSNGTLLLELDGSYVYTPEAGFSGADSFVFAVSDGVESDTATVSIQVTNADPAIPIDNDLTANEVEEGAAVGDAVGVTVFATDPDDPAVTYSLTNDAGGRFAIDATTGVVTVADGTLLDYETATSHTITIQASDGAGGTSTWSPTINVTNVDPSIPTDDDLENANQAPEGAAIGTTVGVTARSTDPNGTAVAYTLTNNAGGRFAIPDPNSGVVTVADGTLLDYETATSHNITVQASDGAGGTSSWLFTINVTDVALTAPTDTDASANQVAEGAAQNTPVGVTAFSEDPNGPAVAYSLTDDAGGRFAIHATTGVVAVADGTLLDYETATSHDVTVQADAAAAGTTTAVFTINVTNVAPSTPTDSNTTTADAVAEGAVNGTTVGLTADSDDPNGSAVTYSLTDDAGGRFAIHPATGVITVADGTLLDFETDTSHGVTVEASDGAGGTSTWSPTIDVTDVALPAPTDDDLAANEVAEGAAIGTTVGVTAFSEDPNGPAVTYSLTDDAGGRFAIHATTGVVTVADGTLLDFETTTSHDITVRADAGAAGATTETFTINVTNVAPTAPADSDTTTTDEVAEGAALGTTVGLTAHSDDPIGPAVTYSLTDDAGGRFEIHSNTGVVTVLDGDKLDYEVAQSHGVTIQARDGAGATSTETFTINVTNEAPTIDVNPWTLNAQQSVEFRIGPDRATTEGLNHILSVTANDPHEGDPETASLAYSITGGNSEGMFAIDSSSGVITLVKELSTAQAIMYQLEVTVTDGNAASTGDVTITIDDVSVGVAGDTQGIEGSSDLIRLRFVRFASDMSLPLTVHFTVNWSPTGASPLSPADLAAGASLTTLQNGTIVIPATESEVTLELVPLLDAVANEGIEAAWVTVVEPPPGPQYAVVAATLDPTDKGYKKQQSLDVYRSVKLQVLDGVTLFADNSLSGATPVDSNEIDYNDIDQGGLGDCYFLAAMAALAKEDPAYIRAMITEDPSPQPYDYIVNFGGLANDVNVDFELERGFNAAQLSGDYNNLGVEIWPQVLEMAFAQQDPDGWDGIEGGWVNESWELLTGTTDYGKTPLAGLSNDQILQTIQNAHANNQLIWLDTGDNPAHPEIVGPHAYYVLYVDSTTNPFTELVLYNPHGEEIRINCDEYTLSDIFKYLYRGDLP